MKKILYDLTSAQPEGNVIVNGGGQYSVIIFEELLRILDNITLEVTLNSLKGKNHYIEKLCSDNNIKILTYCTLNKLSELINCGLYEKVVFPVCYPSYSKIKINADTVVISVIHDLSSIYADNCHNAERLVGYGLGAIKELIKIKLIKKMILNKHIREHRVLTSLGKKQIIITDSEYSKYAMQYYLKDQIKAYVHYLPIRTTPIPDTHTNTLHADLKKIEKKKYFLLVSGNRWHKNNYIAVNAIDELYSRGMLDFSYKVVITGIDKKHKAFYERRIRNKNNFILCDYISEEALENLYRNAYALIYPSLYEGFGYPPVIAMKYGTIAICSMLTSIKEICKDAVLYFDPYDMETISIAILQSLDNEISKLVLARMITRYAELQERQCCDTKKTIDLILY